MAGERPVNVLLWGEDGFLLREAAMDVLTGLRMTEVDAAVWVGGETTDLATPSLFGERRGLLVTGCRSLGEPARREIAGYLAAPSPDAALVLVAEVAERGKPPAAAVKLVEGAGGVVRKVEVLRRDLARWIGERARSRGVTLAPDGAQALLEVLGESPAELDQAIVQLLTAVGDQRVGRDEVHRQFRGLGEQRVWDLCDRAFGRDLPSSIRSLRALLESREDPILILGGISSRLRDLIRVKSVPERTSPSEVARIAGLRFEWQGRRYREQARRFGDEELVRLHGRVVEADRVLKTGAPGDVVLPVLVAEIAGVSGG